MSTLKCQLSIQFAFSIVSCILPCIQQAVCEYLWNKNFEKLLYIPVHNTNVTGSTKKIIFFWILLGKWPARTENCHRINSNSWEGEPQIRLPITLQTCPPFPLSSPSLQGREVSSKSLRLLQPFFPAGLICPKIMLHKLWTRDENREFYENWGLPDNTIINSKAYFWIYHYVEVTKRT